MSGLSRLLLEVAITSAEDARVAAANGADRLELSAALALGGLTPSLGTIQTVRQATELPVLVLIRPRPAGFHYSDAEFAAMCRDVELALAAGVDGIVFGILTAEGNVDRDRCEKLRKLAGDRTAVFHRAFDVVGDPFAALEEIIQMDFERILTSGQEASTLEGSLLIHRLIEQSGGRIEILPGGGINQSNVREVVGSTGCRQVHGSFRAWWQDSSTASRSRVRFGNASSAAEDRFDATDADAVRKVRGILDEMAQSGGKDNRR